MDLQSVLVMDEYLPKNKTCPLETLVIHQTTRCHNSENHTVNFTSFRGSFIYLI
jgi:hypothetical protein